MMADRFPARKKDKLEKVGGTYEGGKQKVRIPVKCRGAGEGVGGG